MKSLIILFLLLISTASFAQKQQVIVKGKVQEAANGKALEFATISFQSVANPAFLTGGVTNSNGEFSIEVPIDTYTIKIDFISFKPIILVNQRIEKATDLGIIQLEIAAELLKEMEIVGRKTEVEFQLDKKVFNVGTDLISKGGSVTDVLENLPSVTVDVDGMINLRGNSNVQILINGKPSIITSNGGLEQLPANSIERIEVITNPSARYEAQGTAGIINIILKKNQLTGWSGSVLVRAGNPTDYRGTINLNYKTAKLNLFSTVGFNYTDFLSSTNYLQRSTYNGIEEQFGLSMLQNRNDNGRRLFFGGDYTFNEHNTLTLSAYHYRMHNTDISNSFYEYTNAAGEPDSTILRTENYFEPQFYNQWELNYVKTFAKPKQKLTITAEYDFFNDDEQENITSQNLLNPARATKILSQNLESNDDFLVQADFILPISDQTTLEMGLRGETRLVSSDYFAGTLVDDAWQTIGDFDNKVDYYEKIGAAYFQYAKKHEKFSYLLGIRSEFTAIRIEDKQDFYQIEKDYLRFFPTVHLTYTASENNKVQLSYARRISRPSFWQLNPFGGVSDPRNLWGGNPYLDPAYTNAFELSFLHHGKKWSINPSIYHNSISNYFFRIVELLDDGTVFRTNTNQSIEKQVGLELSTTFTPTSWWTLTGNFNFYHLKLEGFYKDVDLTNTNETWTARINSRIRLPKIVNIQTSFNYQGRNQNAQTTNRAIYSLDFAISKDFLKEKASFTLRGRNILNTRRFRWISTGENFWQDAERIYFKNRWSLTFSYRFNQKKNERERQPSRSNR